MSFHVYKKIELVGSSSTSIEDAISNAKYDKILALAAKVPIEEKWKGSRNMTKYFGVETIPEGAEGPITEAAPALHQPRGVRALLGGDQVQGAELVVVAEAAPVRERLVELEHLLGLEGRAKLGHDSS